jgi:hypothetical protein
MDRRIWIGLALIGTIAVIGLALIGGSAVIALFYPRASSVPTVPVYQAEPSLPLAPKR